jgi:hypothetical protein
MFGLGLQAAGCALPPWIGHHPVFPAGPKTWEIPLYEPLTSLGPKVVATVCGPARASAPRACEEALLYVDTGSSHSALPAPTFARLGVETTGSRFATIEDAAGESRGWLGGLVPEVRLGDALSLTDVVTVVHSSAILGADVLTEHGWRIDRDRGTLVLGPAPSSSATRLPIRGFPKRTIVDLSVQGRGVPLLLDTGAPITIVDVGWLKAAGLSLRSLEHGWPLSARDPGMRLSDATDADLRLGGLDLGRRQIVGHPRGDDGVTLGYLGLDLLADYAFGVSDGAALELERRPSSSLPSVRERIRRWPDLPRCPDVPGCVSAQLEPTDGVRFRMRALASSPGAYRYVFGCVDPKGQMRDLPIWVEVGLRALTAGQERVVDVEMPERLRPLWKVGCESLALLDVNPVLPAERPMTADVDVRLVFGDRRIRLN